MSETILKKTIVTVHGVGDQTEYESAKKVLAQFAIFHNKWDATPLGSFHNEDGVFSESFEYLNCKDEEKPVTSFNFAEAYWADIPRKMVKEGFQLEDAEGWGKTVAGRVRNRMEDSPAADKTCSLLEQVLKEVLQTIDVLDKLFYLAGRMGIFKFDLKSVLDDNLGDVQIVGDFEDRRNEIVDAFDLQISKAYAKAPDADIYIVAHSEGTVVSLLGMLRAFLFPDVETEVEVCISPTEKKTLKVKRSDWLNRVKGYMTFGSPIDKHIELWGHIFNGLELPPSSKRDDKIEWRNYYDINDPIGYELDEARERVNGKDAAEWGWGNLFNFPTEGDFGFSRYPLPGEAHNEYWTDKTVFGHFIENVVYKDNTPIKRKFNYRPANKPPNNAVTSTDKPKKLPNKWWWWPFSQALPYVLDFGLLFCAVLVIYKAVSAYLSPDTNLSVSEMGYKVGGITCLLAGITLIARITRLTKPGLWWAFGLLFFIAMCACYRLLLGQELVMESQPGITNFGFVSIAWLVFLGGWVLNAVFPTWGMRTLLIPGAIAVLTIVIAYLVEGSGSDHGDLWPVVLATAFFLYLWWLVALVFDLVFIWHWYVRQSQKNMKIQKAN